MLLSLYVASAWIVKHFYWLILRGVNDSEGSQLSTCTDQTQQPQKDTQNLHHQSKKEKGTVPIISPSYINLLFTNHFLFI